VSAPSFPVVWGAYYDHLKVERNRRPKTITAYRQVLGDFAGWLDPTPWWQATPQHVRAYLDRGCHRQSARPGQPLGPASRAFYGTVLVCFYAWAAREGLLDADPLRTFIPQRRPAPIPRALEVTDVTRLLERAAVDPRLEAMIMMGYGLGMRAGEVAAARVEHLQLHGSHPFILVDGKGGRRRRIPLSEPVREVLVRFLDGRRAGPVIQSKQHPGRHVLSRAVSRAVSQAMREVGIPDAAHHTLRHTFCTLLLEQGRGANLYSVSKLMGHSSTTITETTYSAYLGDLDATIGLLPDPRGGARA